MDDRIESAKKVKTLEVVELTMRTHLLPEIDEIVWVSIPNEIPCRVLAHFENGDLEVCPLDQNLSAFAAADWGDDFPLNGWDAR